MSEEIMMMFQPLLKKLAIARTVANDETLDRKVKALQLLSLCNTITSDMDIIYDVLNDALRQAPHLEPQIASLRYRLDAIKLEFRKVALEINIEVL